VPCRVFPAATAALVPNARVVQASVVLYCVVRLSSHTLTCSSGGRRDRREMAETLSLRGVLKGHDGWVTCIATSSELPNKILSGESLCG
jgi:hypothetical protein